MLTFAALKADLENIDGQNIGRPGPTCETGDPYVEFYASAYARPGDEALMEATVAEEMQLRLGRYFSEGRYGCLYWRMPLEWEIAPHSIVIQLDENGPDIDFITGQRCVKDHNWIKIAAYCRLFRAKTAAIAA